MVSVLMINAQGIMISVLGNDYFISYNRIPWMQDAPIRSVLNVQMSGPEAIEWQACSSSDRSLSTGGLPK